MPVRLSMRRVCVGERRAADMQGCICHAMYADMRERNNEAQIEDEDRKWKILVTTSLSDCRFFLLCPSMLAPVRSFRHGCKRRRSLF
jgi:hypothetical protein